MRRFTWIMVVLAGMTVLNLSPPKIAAEDVPKITAEELKAKLGDPDIIVLDVRPAGQWERSDQKITGAVREDHLDVEGWAGNYAHNKTLVLYCG